MISIVTAIAAVLVCSCDGHTGVSAEYNVIGDPGYDSQFGSNVYGGNGYNGPHDQRIGRSVPSASITSLAAMTVPNHHLPHHPQSVHGYVATVDRPLQAAAAAAHYNSQFGPFNSKHGIRNYYSVGGGGTVGLVEGATVKRTALLNKLYLKKTQRLAQKSVLDGGLRVPFRPHQQQLFVRPNCHY